MYGGSFAMAVRELKHSLCVSHSHDRQDQAQSPQMQAIDRLIEALLWYVPC